MAEKIAIGIDIGGTYTKIALVNQGGEVSRLARLQTASHAGVEDYLNITVGETRRHRDHDTRFSHPRWPHGAL